MGLERMVCIIQGGKTNFDTDLFLPIIREIEKLSGKTYSPDSENMSFKVIADHIRSLSFAIGDGALPGNEGRGYVYVAYFVARLCMVKIGNSREILGFTRSDCWENHAILLSRSA